MNIRELEITGNRVVETEVIKEIIEKEITGYYFGLFPKTNFLFYSKGRIENKLYQEFKILKDISMSIQNTKTLLVSVSERIPKYTWCGQDLPVEDLETGQSKCYFMDENGYIFSLAPYFSGDVYFKFYGAVFQNPNDIFTKLVLLKENLEKMELRPVSLVAQDDGKIEIYLSSKSSLGPKIILKNDFDAGKIVENLQTALDTEPLKTDLKKKYSSFLYIDLTFGNKVYYKFK